MLDIPVIVVTGGPCAGKTTLLARISQRLSDFGFKVILVPEIATDLINSGITPWELGVQFQEFVLKGIWEREELYKQAAWSFGQKTVLIADRGMMDGKAYCEETEFFRLLERHGFNQVTARDERYSGVIHLVSAAVGAEDFYTLDNNKARKENVDQARELDQRTCNAWNGHPHLRVIGNGTSFEEKMRRAEAAICHLLGVPEPLEIERKYNVAVLPADILFQAGRLPHYVAVDIQQIYLEDGSRIRERGKDGSYVYYYTQKKEVRPGVRTEIERRIDQKEFDHLRRNHSSQSHRPIIKQRVCFTYDGQYLELDYFISPKQLRLLEVELLNEDDPVNIPDFIEVIEDVTHDPRFLNKEIAKI